MDGYTYVPANPGWDWVVSNMATIPVVSLGLGPVAGLGAARLVSSHFSLMVKELSQVFVAGPPLVEKIGEKLTKEELGGYNIHGKNGVIDNVTFTERGGPTSPPFDGINLKSGDRMREDWFPKVFSN